MDLFILTEEPVLMAVVEEAGEEEDRRMDISG